MASLHLIMNPWDTIYMPDFTILWVGGWDYTDDWLFWQLEYCEVPIFFSTFSIAESIWCMCKRYLWNKLHKNDQGQWHCISQFTYRCKRLWRYLPYVTVVQCGNDFLGSASCTPPSQIKLLPNLLTKLIIMLCVHSLSKLNLHLRKTM